MFSIMLVYYQLMAIIAMHSVDNLGASSSSAGLAAGIFMLAALTARIFSGKFIEYVGRKRMFLTGLIIYLFATALYFGAENLILLFIIRIIHGVGFGIATTSAMTIAAGIIPSSRRGEGMSYFNLSITLASAIGPSLGIYLYDYSSFSGDRFWNICLLWSGNCH